MKSSAKKARASVHTARAYFKGPHEMTLKEIIMTAFRRKEISDQNLIDEFCEIHYGPSWDVLIGFEGFCFDHPERNLDEKIEIFLHKKT